MERNRVAIAAAIFLGASVVHAAPTVSLVWESTAELMAPEAVVHDTARDVLYVSNVNGAPNDKDGNGFISRMRRDGSIEDLSWIAGMNAPKGMAISGDRLYVSDVDELIEIDLSANAIARRFRGEGAQFLNDVAVDAAGNVYVSDMLTNRIYRFDGERFGVWLESPALENPNGLHVDGDVLYVGCWGVMTDGFATKVPGRIKAVKIVDQSFSEFGGNSPVGNIDGLELLADGTMLATDWMAGKLLSITPSGEVSTLLTLKQGTADIGLIADDGLLLIPMMNDNRLLAYRLDR